MKRLPSKSAISTILEDYMRSIKFRIKFRGRSGLRRVYLKSCCILSILTQTIQLCLLSWRAWSACLPDKSNFKMKHKFAAELYKQRNLIYQQPLILQNRNKLTDFLCEEVINRLCSDCFACKIRLLCYTLQWLKYHNLGGTDIMQPNSRHFHKRISGGYKF